MDLPEIKLGSKVYDHRDRRPGVVLSVHRPANPNLSSTTAMIQVGDNTVSWIEFENLSQTEEVQS